MRQPPPVLNLPRYPVTGGMILLAIGTSIYGWAGHPIDALLDSPLIRDGELWRLATTTMPHANFIHLAFNAYWIWVFGTLIEDTFGPIRTLLLAILLAMVASAAEYAFLDGGIGLSGVGYGYFGLMWVLSTRDRRFEDAVDRNTITLFVVWFFVCIVTTLLKVMPIANLAHAAGCGMGAAIGFAIAASGPKRKWIAAADAVLAIGCVLLAMYGRPIVNVSGSYPDEARLGYAALCNNDNEQAARWLRIAVKIAPREPGIWTNLGIAEDQLDNHPAAAAAFKRAGQLQSGNAE